MTLSGTIDGLKVGRILLQKVEDSTLVTLDSIQVDGDPNFSLSMMVDEPQLVYVHLDVKDGTQYDDRISLFAEPGMVTLHADLDQFDKTAVVSGSKNDSILTIFKKNKMRLDQAYTELVKRSMVLSRAEDAKMDDLEKLDADYNKHIRKSVLYAVNFARLHKDYEVAPYILLSEAFDANPILLDSTFVKMPKKIQASRYGKQLSELIEESKEVNGL